MARPDAPIPIERIPGDLDEAIQETLSYHPDLIIEGATNNRNTLCLLFQDQYQGPYVGMDINPDIDYGASHFTVYGNCLNPNHVRRVMRHHGARKAAFVTFNGLNDILSNKIGPWDRKDREDQFTVNQAVENITRLYGIQMHIIYGGFFDKLRYFYERCIGEGWKIKQFGKGEQLMILTRDSDS
ncbi:hypothetical protein HY032_01820 [Candidatus Gottesmanbacteria bacterium]|nr:hypothetical protein [Candidatus Gottesmanbacteria bacterium]